MFKKIAGGIIVSTISLCGIYGINSENLDNNFKFGLESINIFQPESAFASDDKVNKVAKDNKKSEVNKSGENKIQVPNIESSKVDPDIDNNRQRELNQEIVESKPNRKEESLNEISKSNVSKNVLKTGKNIENDKVEKDINDFYFVGLKAFDEKLFDVATTSLKKYLSFDDSSKKAIYATYILYQSLIMEKKYTESLDYIEKLNKYQDKRIDRSKIRTDYMKIEVGLGCDKAKSALINSPNQEYISEYLKSECEVDADLKNVIARNKLSAENLNYLLPRIQNDLSFNILIYNNLNNEYKTNEIKNYFATYFYSKKEYNMFNKIYAEYSDNDLVILKLDYLYNNKDPKSYIDLFNEGLNKKYKFASVTYCRMIDSSNKMGKDFDCTLADSCYVGDTFNKNKTKLACYLKNKDKNGTHKIMKELTADDAVKLCEYGRYAVNKRFYANESIGKFSKCKDNEKASMFEDLFEYKDYNAMLALVGNNKSQMNLAYAAMAYYKKGHMKSYNAVMEKLKDKKLIKMVRSRVK